MENKTEKAKVYVDLISREIKTVDDVPESLVKEVKILLGLEE